MINISSHIYFKIAVACVSSCIFFTACENNINEVKALGSKAGGIDVGKDVAIYISNDGKVTAKLMAPLMLSGLEHGEHYHNVFHMALKGLQP